MLYTFSFFNSIKKKKIITKLKKLDATSENKAKTLEESGINSDIYLDLLQKLLNEKKLIKTINGKYYINEEGHVWMK